ncbi:MAG: ABC transporter substrate-binding protein [Pseudolabrys sp.]
MKRRDFIKVVGSGAAWPFVARAQQSTMPVVGFVNAASAKNYTRQLAAFLKGLSETGYVAGQNVEIEYRWAEGRNDQLPAMVADLVHRQVAVIAATSTPAALAAKAANTTIPIVFETGADPIKIGLVGDLSRPGGQVTGVSQTNVEMAPKRMQLLHELIPTASVMALFVNPADGTLAEAYSREVQAAARTLGVELHILNVSTDRDLDGAFAKLIESRAGGLVISGGAFLTSRNEQLAALALHHAVPTIFADREFAAAGGLLSYGAAIADAYRLAGHYTGRILKGDKPADLPVQLATKVELYINLKTAKTLGVNIPNTLIGRADEVIE